MLLTLSTNLTILKCTPKSYFHSVRLCFISFSKFVDGQRTLNCCLLRNFSVTTKNHSSNLGPASDLSKKIASGELLPDDHQTRVAQSLQKVYIDVKDYSPPINSIFSKIFAKKVKKKIPKGLYIYGSVGGGKTMLMDLFYECAEVS